MSWANSQVPTITETSSSWTSAKPCDTAACSSSPPVFRIVIPPMRSAVRKGSWPGSTPNSPSLPGSTTDSAWSLKAWPSGVTTLTAIGMPDYSVSPSAHCARRSAACRRLERLGLGTRVLDRADHEEGLLGQVVALAVEDLLEAPDRVGDADVDALRARELLGDVEGLRQEALDLAGACHREAVVLGELVHAEDRDDVLEVLVLLERLLDAARHAVVLLAHDQRVEDAARRVERIDRGIDALLGDRAREHRGGVEVREGRGGRRVGEVVGRHVDRLHGGDRALGGRGDALLERAHVGGERRLVAHRRGDAAEQRRHLGARLREAEDVVDEEQHVLALFVAEVLGAGEGREADARARAGRLVHLAVDQRGLVEHGGSVRELRIHHVVP